MSGLLPGRPRTSLPTESEPGDRSDGEAAGEQWKGSCPIGTLVIHCRDNLPVLRTIHAESVDAIYIDPPLNTGKVQKRTTLSTVQDPTQKPRGVIDRIVKVHSRPDDLLLEFLAGSGTLGESAVTLGRRCILVDSTQKQYSRWSGDLLEWTLSGTGGRQGRRLHKGPRPIDEPRCTRFLSLSRPAVLSARLRPDYGP